MRRTAATFVLVMGFASAFAADATDPERLAEARALIAAMRFEAQIDGLTASLADTMTKQFTQSQPVFNRRAVQIYLEESMLSLKDQLGGPDGLAESMARGYAAQFSFAELRQIREFHESPAGQHLLRAGPELMKATLPGMIESGRAARPRICAKAKARMVAEKIEGADAMKCPESP